MGREAARFSQGYRIVRWKKREDEGDRKGSEVGRATTTEGASS